MDYLEKLRQTSDKFSSIVCMGLDPVLADIPEQGSPGQQIRVFYEKILDKIVQKGIFPSAVKPNYAFYAQYGIEGIEALSDVIKIYSDAGLPVILDAKRGDIGKTARAYAAEAFDFFKADAVTLSPYLGYDSISPFVENYPDKGFYVLTKTSNKSSGEIQDIEYNGSPLYMYMARKLIDWYSTGLGSVVGATYPEQLEQISGLFNESGREVPFLIPGIGAQGGSLEAVLGILKKGGDIRIHRINSSSGINFAYKKYEGMHYADAAVRALDELNGEISAIL